MAQDVEQLYANSFKDANAHSKGSTDVALGAPNIIVPNPKYNDAAKEIKRRLESLYKEKNRQLSKHGLKMDYPKRIIVDELDYQISLIEYMKKCHGKPYIITQPVGVGKIFGIYNPETDEMLFDPVMVTDDTEFANQLKKYGFDVNPPSLDEVLIEENIHRLQKKAGILDKSGRYRLGKGLVEGHAGTVKKKLGIKATSYKGETEITEELFKKYRIDSLDALNGGLPEDIYREYDILAKPCHDSGRCIAK